jgi:hypothetical protein
VVVLEAAGPLSEVVEGLDRQIRLALAEGPRGVVCDLSGVPADAGWIDAGWIAAEVLATAGRHVRDWSGTPVAVASPDPLVRLALEAHPLGRRLIVTESMFSAMSAVLGTPAPDSARLRLAPHPTAPRASRGFVARTLREWRLDLVSPLAAMVAGELVASSSVNAGTDIDLSVGWHRGALRIAVRDHGPAMPGQRQAVRPPGRGLRAVACLSHAFGSMPTTDGGNLVWAVLVTPRPHRPTGDGVRG